MDILRTPVVGPFLRHRAGRTFLQILVLAIAAAAVLHGLLGPQIAPRNLATVLTSIHWRGLLLVAIVAAGNLFCTACPMMLARDTGRRFFHARLPWPRRLRGKWVGLVLLVIVLFAYERLDVWGSPSAVAWTILGYFAAAVAVDTVFAGASFCKHVCPIGQFNFIASTMSPTELRIRDVGTCGSCRTADCIKGRPALEPQTPALRGCELGLFLPAKVGNLDCTLCLDCVHACPHDNVALVIRVPGAELVDQGRRAGIGRLGGRPDLAALAAIFTFASLLSAFIMTAPARAVESRLANLLPLTSGRAGLVVLFLVGIGLAPIALVTGAAAATRSLAGAQTRSLRWVAVRYVHALVPLGVGVWLAHYGFHLLTGALTAVPVAQSAAIDLVGLPVLGEPWWTWVGIQSGSVFPLQCGVVLVGALGSLGLVLATSLRDHPTCAALASAPWIVLVGGLAAAAWWIFAQPMDMRGLSVFG